METQSLEELYNHADIDTMRHAEAAKLPGKNRVEEIRNYAKLAGIKRVGIANCVMVQKEAEMLRSMLSSDFEVFSIDCKHGKIPSADLIGGEAKGLSCNPSGQAQFLAHNNTELNIAMGLCVGHDLVFSLKSSAPVTTLVVKDRQHKNNPVETFKS